MATFFTKAKYSRGHNLLEALVAAGLFIVITVALSGIWVMYGRALAKSGEHLAANQLARGVTEGLIANGFDWLVERAALPLPDESEYSVVRKVRGRPANINYNILYDLELNDTGARQTMPRRACRIEVTVRWKSASGNQDIDSGRFNESVRYVLFVYREAI